MSIPSWLPVAARKSCLNFRHSHFQRHTFRLLKFFHIAAANDNFETELPGCLLNEAFIGVTARAAKLMVEVGYNQFPIERRRKAVQHVKQNHRVAAARNRHEHTLAAAEEASRTNGFFNPTGQVNHRMSMLEFYGELGSQELFTLLE